MLSHGLTSQQATNQLREILENETKRFSQENKESILGLIMKVLFSNGKESLFSWISILVLLLDLCFMILYVCLTDWKQQR